VSDRFSPLRLNVGFIAHETIGFSHTFEFDLPSLTTPPDLTLHGLQGQVVVTRLPQGLLVQPELKASVTVDCARCLNEFEQPLAVEFSELYAFNQKSVTESGLILPDNEYIDLTPIVREYMILEVPINPICRLDCKGLCLECGSNKNEIDCGHIPTTGDSRFDVLKALL